MAPALDTGVVKCSCGSSQSEGGRRFSGVAAPHCVLRAVGQHGCRHEPKSLVVKTKPMWDREEDIGAIPALCNCQP